MAGGPALGLEAFFLKGRGGLPEVSLCILGHVFPDVPSAINLRRLSPEILSRGSGAS